MKTATLVLLALLSYTMAFSLLDDMNPHPHHHDGNIGMVIETNVGGMDLIADELISLQHNKVKVQYTTFNGQVPAFDLVMDYTTGTGMQYFNLTGDCKTFEIPTLNLTQYYASLLKDHTEHAGHRGEHLEVYEVKHPEEEGSRTWVYGVYIDHPHMESKVFVPTRFQSHHPAQKESPDYAGEWIDTFSHPHVDASTFDYPQCAQAANTKLDVPVTFGILGLNSDALLALIN